MKLYIITPKTDPENYIGFKQVVAIDDDKLQSVEKNYVVEKLDLTPKAKSKVKNGG